jgi:hypothetical protein
MITPIDAIGIAIDPFAIKGYRKNDKYSKQYDIGGVSDISRRKRVGL